MEIDDLVAMFEASNTGREDMAEARKWVASNSARKQSLKSLRLAAGLSQAALAKAINMSQPNVSALEAGSRLPVRATVKKLAKVLGVSVSDLYAVIEGQEESTHV